jgi:hypothetical protein
MGYTHKTIGKVDGLYSQAGLEKLGYTFLSAVKHVFYSNLWIHSNLVPNVV